MANSFKTTNYAGTSLDYGIEETALAMALNTLDETLIFSNLITDRSDQARRQGAGFAHQVRIPKYSSVSSSLKTPGTDISASTQYSFNEGVYLTTNRHRFVDFTLEDYGSLYTDEATLAGIGVEAAKAIAEAVEEDIIAEYVNAGAVVGDSGTAGSDTFVREVKKTTRTQLFRTSQPTFFVIGAGLEDQLFGEDRFALVNQSGSGEVLMNANLGPKYGMNFYYSSLMPVVTNTPASEISMTFQREAIAIAFIDMNTDNKTMTSGAANFVSMDYRSPQTNYDGSAAQYSMRMEKDRDMDAIGTRVRFDTIYGIETVRPELLIEGRVATS